MELEAYCASMVQALHATHNYIKNGKPEFDVINLIPSFIVGKNELVIDPEHITVGTNSTAMGAVLGKHSPMLRAGSTIHVNNTAKLHVLALDLKIKGNQDFVASSGGPTGNTLQDATAIVESNFPEAVRKGIFKNNGSQPTKSLRIDASKTEEVFGIKFLLWEDQVKSVAGHYLEMVGEA